MNVRLLFLLLFLALARGSEAATYYVCASGGDDAASGQSAAAAWQTLERVNRARLLPGDSVLLKRGEVWHEELKPPASGSVGDPITFGAYGEGARPVISGRLKGASGSEQFRDCNIDNHEQSHIVYDGLDLREAREGLRLFAWSGDVKNITLKNSVIQSERSQPHGTMSAGVYASVETGRLSEIIIENNTFVPFPTTLEHWGIYFVKGVSNFTITANTFGPAGEDAITIWHSQSGVIERNRGGGNGENTVDVKDSHDIVIRNNRGEADGEYNIVVHGVDSERGTFHIKVEHNFCLRGGQAGQLTSGIAILFAQDVQVVDNWVEDARGAGIFENDRGEASGNEIARNQLRHNGTHDGVGAITLERPAIVAVAENVIDGQGSGGFAIRIEGSSHDVKIRENRLIPGTGHMMQLTAPEEATAKTVQALHPNLSIDDNTFYHATEPQFQIGRNALLLEQWRDITRADAHSHALPASAFVSTPTASAAAGH